MRILLIALVMLGVTAACSTTPAGTASPPTGTTGQASAAAVSTTTTAASTSAADPQQALRDAFPGLMRSLGFFPGGTPDEAVDAAANAVCGGLRTSSMSAEIAYEKSVDKNATTGMTTDQDIVTFVGDSVRAFCPQYAGQLPSR